MFTQWYETVKPEDPSAYISAAIEPWAIKPLFGIDPLATIDKIIDLEAFDSAWSAELLIEVEKAEAPSDLLDKVELAILRRSPGDLEPTDDVARLTSLCRQSAGAIRIDSIAKQLALSDRQLRRISLKALGMTTKQWCILERFAANLRRLHPSPWHSTGTDPDYFDQAHEIHEFRRMAGVTPRAYRRDKMRGDARVFTTRCTCPPRQEEVHRRDRVEPGIGSQFALFGRDPLLRA